MPLDKIKKLIHMRNEGSNCIIFSSQTGVNVGCTLNKLSKFCRTRRKLVVVRKVESQMSRTFLKKFPKDSTAELIRTSAGLQYLVFKPKPLLCSLWKEALAKTLDKLPRRSTLFLSIHPILYSSDSREYFSPVDVDHLRKVLAGKGCTVGMVVSLIDDIYDVFRRLRAPEQLFSELEDKQQEQAVIECIVEHLMLLDWRSKEIMRAEQVAHTLGVHHYVLATKHPLQVAYDLIFSKKVPVYVSHPISAVRMLEAEGKLGEAKSIMAEINGLITHLVRSRKVLPFFPTTIDEFRIAKEGDTFVPRLGPRWPFGDPKSLLYCEAPKEPLEPLDPDDWYDEAKTKHPEKVSVIHELLRTLRDRIGMQVGARDKKLVEQSEGIVVFRPYFGGALSEGVQKEIVHRNNLNEYCPSVDNERRSVTAISSEDLVTLRTRLIADELAKRALLGRAKLSLEQVKRVTERFGSSSKLKNLLMKGKLTAAQLQKAVQDALSITGSIVFDGIPRSLGPLSGELKAVQRAWVQQQWRALVDQVNSSDPLRKDLKSGIDIVLPSGSIRELIKKAEATIPKSH